MIKSEAIEAMERGEKVTHPRFNWDEYICMRDGAVYDECDYELPTFWEYRWQSSWEGNWSIVKKE